MSVQSILLGLQTSGAGGYDTDAQTFFTAAGITDTTQKDAVNALVLSLKSAGAWTKLKAIYPFVGGDATKHSYNLKNPAAHQITWNGTVTHNANGIQGNGSTGYGNTNYNQNTHGTDDDEYLACYSRTQTPNSGMAIGVRVAASTDETYLRFDSGTYRVQIQSNTNQSTSNSDYRGFFSGNRLGTATFLRINGTQTTSTVTANRSKCNLNYFICGRNNDGSLNLPSNAQFAFFCIGLGLTTTEDTAVYNAVVTFQTALSRNV